MADRWLVSTEQDCAELDVKLMALIGLGQRDRQEAAKTFAYSDHAEETVGRARIKLVEDRHVPLLEPTDRDRLVETKPIVRTLERGPT